MAVNNLQLLPISGSRLDEGAFENGRGPAWWQANAGQVSVFGQVHDVQYHGATSRVELALDGGMPLVVSVNNDETGEADLPHIGDPAFATWPESAMVMLKDRL